MKNKKGVDIALPWEKILWWALLILFTLFIFWYYARLRGQALGLKDILFK